MFKSIARMELDATNGNVVRVDFGPDGSVKIAARKGTHNQSVSVLPPKAARALLAFLSEGGV